MVSHVATLTLNTKSYCKPNRGQWYRPPLSRKPGKQSLFTLNIYSLSKTSKYYFGNPFIKHDNHSLVVVGGFKGVSTCSNFGELREKATNSSSTGSRGTSEVCSTLRNRKPIQYDIPVKPNAQSLNNHNSTLDHIPTLVFPLSLTRAHMPRVCVSVCVIREF